MKEEALKRMIAARAALVLDEPFWGTLALRLRLQEDPTCKTAWVDGMTLGFNPTWISAMPIFAEVTGLFAHEVGHCVLGHPWRKEGRDHKRWNEAGDRIINPMLREAGFKLPEGGLFELDPSHKGKSTEWVYNRLPQAPPPSGEGEGEGGSGADAGDDLDAEEKMEGDYFDKDTFGEVRDAPADEGDDTPSEEDWKQGVQQAAALAAGQGKLPGSLKRLVEQATASTVDWRSVLRRFQQEVAQSDYSWSRPNRRYLAQGLFLPSLHSQEMGPIVVGIDTSGSIDATLLNMFGAELQAVVEESQPRRVHVLYCDAKIQGEDVFERGDPVTLHPHGGGGTDFRPVFKALEDLEEPPVCVIYLTDLLGTFPQVDPGVPTLWVTPEGYARYTTAPFGETVVVGE